MNISLSEDMKAFVDDQVASGSFVSSSEYVRGLIRRERDRQQLRDMLMEGAASPLTGPMTEADFEELYRLADGK